MVGFIPPAAGATPINMAWDGRNQLIQAGRPADGAFLATSVTYRYDALGRRILKLLFDAAQPTSGTLQAAAAFFYDGWNVIEERDGYNSTPTTRVARRYTWGTDVSGTHQDVGGVGGLLMAEQINGSTITPHYYHYDGNGDVIALTNASGTREARYRYIAFGGNAFTEAALLSFGAVQLYPCQKKCVGVRLKPD